MNHEKSPRGLFFNACCPLTLSTMALFCDLGAFVPRVTNYTTKPQKRVTGHFGGIVGDLRQCAPVVRA
jgi:hypothetical protein